MVIPSSHLISPHTMQNCAISIEIIVDICNKVNARARDYPIKPTKTCVLVWERYPALSLSRSCLAPWFTVLPCSVVGHALAHANRTPHTAHTITNENIDSIATYNIKFIPPFLANIRNLFPFSFASCACRTSLCAVCGFWTLKLDYNAWLMIADSERQRKEENKQMRTQPFQSLLCVMLFG